MDLTKIKLPSAVKVGGNFYNIKTDFREWLKFGRLLEQEQIDARAFDFLYSDFIPADRLAGFNALLDFYSPRKELPRAQGGGNGERVLDYDLDADLIYAAFYEVYKIDLLETDSHGHIKPLHWHKFTALLNGLHNTKLNEVMGYRSYNENNKDDYNKSMIKMRNAWRLPTKETAAAKAAREHFNSLFEKPEK